MKVQKGVRFTYILHTRLVKPKHPLMLPCPGCFHPLLTVNADTVVATNDFGLQSSELKAADHWSVIRHSCGTKITLYWK